MHFFVFQEIAFKSSHLILIKQRRVRTTPHIPDIIHRKFLILLSLFVEVGGTDQLIGLIQKFVSPILFSAYLDMLKATVLIQRHGSVIKKIGVGYQIHPAVSKQATHMLLQFLTIHK